MVEVELGNHSLVFLNCFIVINRIVELLTRKVRSRGLEAAHSSVADDQVGVERVALLGVGLGCIIALELVDDMVVAGMVEIRDVEDEVPPEDDPPGVHKGVNLLL